MLEKDRPGKLFIGGLALDIAEDRLEKIFSKYGRITEVLIIRDKINNQSRGFGFVTFENPQDALDACKGLNDTDLSGNIIHVTEAVVKVDSGMSSPRRGGFSGRGRGGPPRSSGGYSTRGRGAPVSSRDDSYGRREYDRSRDRSPLRKSPILSSRPPVRDTGYSGRNSGPPPRSSDYSSRGPPVSSDRREDRYGSSSYTDSRSSYPPRRDYRSPPRQPRSLLDDPLPARSYARDPPVSSSRAPAYSSREYASSRPVARSPVRDRVPYSDRNDYGNRDDKRSSYESRLTSSGRGDYVPRSNDYGGGRDFGRDVGRSSAPSRDSYNSRDTYPSTRRDIGESSRDYGYSSQNVSRDTYRVDDRGYGG